jgi:Flp pilus assembly pilin Flp
MLSSRHQRKPQRIKARTGQSLAEYGLVLALVSVVAIEGLHLLGGTISGQLQQLAIALNLQPASTGTSFVSSGNSNPTMALSAPPLAASPSIAITSPNSPNSLPFSQATTQPVTATAATSCNGSPSGCALEGSWGF